MSLNLYNLAGALLAALVLAACLPNAEAARTTGFTTPEVTRSGSGGRTCRVFADEGGNPFEYEALRAQLAESCDELRLGECHSSCTILMSLPNACLLPGRRFGFHSSNFGGVANPVLRKYYRAGILERFDQEWSQSRRMIPVTSEEAVVLDPALRIC